jgi:hypothetical protein
MARRQTRGRARRCAPQRVLLVLGLIAALVLGSALGGSTAWLHSHGHSGGHVHLVAAEIAPADLEVLHAWHDARHHEGHEHAPEEEREEGPAPDELLIELPQILAAASRTSTVPTTSVQAPALPASLRWQLALVESVHRPDVCRSGWPPEVAGRSGVAALLRSSHAILI